MHEMAEADGVRNGRARNAAESVIGAGGSHEMPRVAIHYYLVGSAEW